MAVLEQRIKRSNVQYRSKSEKKKKGRKEETWAWNWNRRVWGEWGNRSQRRGDGKANRSEQLRGKEGTTCFAVSLTPAIIHRERPFISCWTWRMEREREQCSPGLLAALLMLALWTLARCVKKSLTRVPCTKLSLRPYLDHFAFWIFRILEVNL